MEGIMKMWSAQIKQSNKITQDGINTQNSSSKKTIPLRSNKRFPKLIKLLEIINFTIGKIYSCKIVRKRNKL